MNGKHTPIASAVMLVLAGAALPGLAQQAAPAPAAPASAAPASPAAPRPQELNAVTVTGIRASVEQSLIQKRNADSHVDVITAEDVGKLPDRNVADSLQRVPGVTISSAGANEGGFDESDRVSMRGTSPSLTQTLINGHGVASGDWFVLNQTGTVGRSVSYTLLPSELVGSVVVHKSSQASDIEGGVVGSVDIVTRKPLDFRKPLTLEASLGGVYGTLPGKTDPQISGLVNWKNAAGTFGVLAQAFYEKRSLRRDGQEILGYEQIAAGSPIATARPDLSGVYYPSLIGSALFEQKRERTGGLIDVQVKPLDNLTFDLSGFVSNMKAPNYNRNYLFWGSHVVNQGQGQAPDAGYVVRNNTLVSANFSPVATTQYGIYDQISRPDASADSSFVSLDTAWKVSDRLSLTSKLGTSSGSGKSPTQDVAEWDTGKGTGAGYRLNGIHSAADFNLGSTNNASPAGAGLDFIFGAQFVDVKDKENWGQIDGEYAINAGPLTALKFGVRLNEHKRDSNGVVAQNPKAATDPADSPFTQANFPSGFANYPGDFGKNLGGAFPRDVWFYSADQLAAFNGKYANRPTDGSREYWPVEFAVKERNTAGYLQGDLEGQGWRGNVGVRLVRTKESVTNNVSVTAATPGAITTSAFGPFVPSLVEHTYTDVLPSANLTLDLRRDLLARFAISKTMTRADYSSLAGSVALSPPAVVGGIGSGSGGNPDLKPVRSTNLDANLEWYFAPRSLLSVGAFYMDLTSYVGFGRVRKSFISFDGQNPQGALVDYDLSVPVNTSGKVKGVELAYEQPLFGNFGVSANYTYASAQESGGTPLVGASKHTGNLGAYFENDRFNARVSYNYRSSFYSGLDRSTAFSQAAVATVTASLGYKVNENFSVSLDGRNLNNPKLKYYALNEDQPRSIYENGRQFYLTARITY